MEKSIFNFIIQKPDGRLIDLHERNLWVSSFRIPSVTPEHITETMEDRHGSVYMGTRLAERAVKANINIEAVDIVDFDLFRDELFQLFSPLEKFYIIRDLQPGKRMEVSVSNSFEIDYLSLEDGEFDIEFVLHSVFMESVGTTLDPLTFDINLWQIGQGLIETDDMTYVHNQGSFKIFNAGDITLHPRVFPLVIEFKGPSENLIIRNQTTGDEWMYFGSTINGDTIRLDGVRAFKNEVSIFGKTNRKLISLAPGVNEFTVSGANDPFTISFDFRFYTL